MLCSAADPQFRGRHGRFFHRGVSSAHALPLRVISIVYFLPIRCAILIYFGLKPGNQGSINRKRKATGRHQPRPAPAHAQTEDENDLPRITGIPMEALRQFVLTYRAAHAEPSPILGSADAQPDPIAAYVEPGPTIGSTDAEPEPIAASPVSSAAETAPEIQVEPVPPELIRLLDTSLPGMGQASPSQMLDTRHTRSATRTTPSVWDVPESPQRQRSSANSATTNPTATRRTRPRRKKV
jgi:hypothetical protein